jgi:ribosomal protein L11 methylase PrmA
VRQFLDLGSGIPTEGNVHEIAQQRDPNSRVVYVDLDPIAVAESLDLLEGNAQVTAIRADLRDPATVLGHPAVRGLLNLDEPVAVLLASVLHFVADDAQAYGLVEQYVDAMAPTSYLLISHGAREAFGQDSDSMKAAAEAYERQTAILGAGRNPDQVARFFHGLDLIDPGIVWVHEWRSSADT